MNLHIMPRWITQFVRIVDLYYFRGLAHKDNGAQERAIASFDEFLDLTQDPNLRKLAEEQLKALGVQ